MRTVFACLFLLLLIPDAIFSKSIDPKIGKLECEHLSDPIAIETQKPVLSWQLVSQSSGKRQTAYRLLVASSSALLQDGKGDYWDSGKVISGNSIQVSYNGKALSSKMKVYWKVMVWNEKNEAYGWSEPASWTMGLLNASDWKGKWIGALEHPLPDSAITFPAPFFRKEFTVGKKIKQATVYVSGLGFYELHLNGKRIGDQVLAPAVTNYDKRSLNKLLYPYDDQSTQRVLYNTFDVTQNLQSRINVVGIQLGNGWYNQRDRRVEGDMWYDTPRLIFQLEIQYVDGTSSTVSSDDTWKTANGPLLKDGIFTGEIYDARLELGDWNSAGYSEIGWKNAMLVRPPTGSLHPQTAPFDKVMRTLIPGFDGKAKDSVYSYHLDETVSGWASISVSGKAGSRIKIR
ncbi:MAG: hypothetical protein EOO88_53370, partial [Pedobacter sp.]